jgi:hypothetical protein
LLKINNSSLKRSAKVGKRRINSKKNFELFFRKRLKITILEGLGEVCGDTNFGGGVKFVRTQTSAV